MKDPKVGQWYIDHLDEKFQVVEYDEADGLVELQYADGDIEELDIDDWRNDEFDETAPPIIEELEHDDDDVERAVDGWGTA